MSFVAIPTVGTKSLEWRFAVSPHRVHISSPFKEKVDDVGSPTGGAELGRPLADEENIFVFATIPRFD